MKALGVVLVILGIVALAYGGITYKRERHVVDVGPIKATTTENRTIPLPPILGVVSLVAGIIILVVPKRRL
jgi:uncharacterized membrane protein HdeD (DUF308 family)